MNTEAMNTPQASFLEGQKVAVLGATRGLGRAIVSFVSAHGARTLAVARAAQSLAQLRMQFPGVDTLALDIAHESAPKAVLSRMDPDILIVCAGATPHAAPIQAQNWEQFSACWETDVKASFFFTQAALLQPLKPGSTIVLVSSGAAMAGSFLSGGYAGAKRMQMFLAEYAQESSDHLGLGLRFLSLSPAKAMPNTNIGDLAIRAYSAYRGLERAEFIERMGPQLPVTAIAEKLVMFALDRHLKSEDTSFLISAEGVIPAQ